MKEEPRASIIINNYNYELFLTESIDSALNQTYENIEVIVVDDGSTDNSRNLIAKYGNRIIPILKDNGGQASSLNAGFKACQGEIILFLDSDDLFHPSKVEVLVNLYRRVITNSKNEDIIFSNFFEVIDAYGTQIEEIDIVDDLLSSPGEWRFLKKIKGETDFFSQEISEVCNSEQVYEFASKYRFIPYLGAPTSALSITHSLAQKVFPIPEDGVKVSADVFFVMGASVLGSVYSTNKCLTQYRIHGNNNWCRQEIKKPFKDQKLFFEKLGKYLNNKLQTLGKDPVFSYMQSMIAKSYYRSYLGYQCSAELIELALSVLKWHVDLSTLSFSLKTILLAIYFRYRLITSNS